MFSATVVVSQTEGAERAMDGVAEISREASPDNQSTVVCDIPAELNARKGVLVFREGEDGKAEIVSVNASNPTWADRYGIYVLGSADDDWVTARQSWPQHAFHITNTDSNGDAIIHGR